jgi:hypothetical protein
MTGLALARQPFVPGKACDRAQDDHDADGDQVRQQGEDDPDRPVRLSSEITMAEKNRRKTASMPTYSTPVAQAARTRSRAAIRPGSKIRMVSHQKPVDQARPAAASSTGPPACPGPGAISPRISGKQRSRWSEACWPST